MFVCCHWRQLDWQVWYSGKTGRTCYFEAGNSIFVKSVFRWYRERERGGEVREREGVRGGERGGERGRERGGGEREREGGGREREA